MKPIPTWQVSLQVVSPSRPNLRHQRQYTVQAPDREAAIQQAKQIARHAGDTVHCCISAHRGFRDATKSRPTRDKNSPKYGVYPHAHWHVTDHRTGAGHAVVNPRGGFVVREITPGVPYGRMTPIRVFARKADAEKLADKLTFG